MPARKFIVTIRDPFYDKHTDDDLAAEIEAALDDFNGIEGDVEPFDEDQQSSKPAEDGNQSLNQTPKENN